MHDPKSLKAQLDLVAVLTQQGLAFRRRGINAFALCPFHTESTPSFCVNPRTQLWHCFGCGAGGDVFTFLQKRHGFSFGQAVRTVAGWIAPVSSSSLDRRPR